ncbi:MAG TPA: hypothetical protein VNM48_19105 [Chloroflexota bacterium]|nr:hypothetical protein [Chloroflexota bacterium]
MSAPLVSAPLVSARLDALPWCPTTALRAAAERRGWGCGSGLARHALLGLKTVPGLAALLLGDATALVHDSLNSFK